MRSIRLIMLAALGAAPAAHAAGDPLCPAPEPFPEPPVKAPDAPGVTRAESDFARSRDGRTTLEGHVGVRRDGQSLAADRVVLDRDSGDAEVRGNVVFALPDFGLHADEGTANLDTGALAVEHARYRLLPPSASGTDEGADDTGGDDRGLADLEHDALDGSGGGARAPSYPSQGRALRLARDERGISTLVDGTWSTCPADAEAWHLDAAQVTLDPNRRQGTARNVSVRFKGVPLLYSPWFRFPLGDERMSGFLAPRIATSTDSGVEFAVPWYWNAAPNFDATLTPRWLQRRGTQIQSEWRWLGPIGMWQLNNEYLPDDDRAGRDRQFTRLLQEGSYGAWRSDVNMARASDNDYFDDLGSSLELSSQSHLRRRADLHWRGDAGRFRARAESYQVLDESLDRPYKRLPQLTFDSGADRGALETDLDSELVQFERDASDTATRLRLVPAATWGAETPGWFVRPRLAVDHTSYRLDRFESEDSERIERTLPIASLDTGVVLDRFGPEFQQTLEPRAFYVYVPEQEQDDIPLFDTGNYGFSFSQLFRERRFTGGDRVGDANRLTLALTSRLLARESGREILRGSIGGIRHFDERTVTLSGDAEGESTSDLIAEVSASPTPNWNATTSVQWNPRANGSEKANTALRYRGPEGGIANLGYRFRRDEQEQIDASFAWPVSSRWQLVARSNYSLRDERNVESLAGVEYNDCCWRFRTVAREYIKNDGADMDAGIYFELVLKGLGPVGDGAGNLLERAILGYRDPESVHADPGQDYPSD